MHDVNSLGSGNYSSGVFDVNTGIWQYRDDDKITQISDFIEGVYTRQIHKQKYTNKKVMTGSKKVLLMFYIRTSNLTGSTYVFDK